MVVAAIIAYVNATAVDLLRPSFLPLPACAGSFDLKTELHKPERRARVACIYSVEKFILERADHGVWVHCGADYGIGTRRETKIKESRAHLNLPAALRELTNTTNQLKTFYWIFGFCLFYFLFKFFNFYCSFIINFFNRNS